MLEYRRRMFENLLPGEDPWLSSENGSTGKTALHSFDGTQAAALKIAKRAQSCETPFENLWKIYL
jgi:hypothetical protein